MARRPGKSPDDRALRYRRMVVDGKSFTVEPSADPIGYEIKPGRDPRRLSDAARPDCSA